MERSGTEPSLNGGAGGALADLAEPVTPIGANAPASDALERFSADPALIALPILAGAKPLGLLNRRRFLERFASQFGWALHAERPVFELMDDDPVIVEVNTDASRLGRLLTLERPEAVRDGFILVRDGGYLGVGDPVRVLARFVRDLETRQRQADAANRAKSHFLANMSHELRTPLNAILGFSEVVRMRALGEGPRAEASYAEYIDDIHASGGYLLALINDILELSRVEAGVRDLNIETLDADAAVRKGLRLLQPMADARGVRIEYAAEAPCAAAADARAFQQILMNFGSNAIKFSPPGGVVGVSLSASPDGRAVRLTVEDQGPGLAATRHSGDAMIASKKGAGLGLTLCRELAAGMGGEVVTGDRPGGGAFAQAILRGAAGAAAA